MIKFPMETAVTRIDGEKYTVLTRQLPDLFVDRVYQTMVAITGEGQGDWSAFDCPHSAVIMCHHPLEASIIHWRAVSDVLAEPVSEQKEETTP